MEDELFQCAGVEMDFSDELKLIAEIKKREVIYSAKYQGFNSRYRRDEAWSEVAEMLKISEADCRRKWWNLRDRFVRDGDGAPNTPHTLLKIFAEMEFLKEHVRRRSTSTIPKSASSRPSSPTVKHENGDFEDTFEATQFTDGSIYADAVKDNDLESLDLPYSPTNESQSEFINETGGTPVATADTPSSSSALAKVDKLKLINEVRKREVLYLRSCGSHKFIQARIDAWQQIASEMQLSVNECKYKWKVQRDRYVKECGTSKPCSTVVREYYSHMEFLRDHIRPKTTTTKLQHSTAGTSSTSTTTENPQVFELSALDEAQFNKSAPDAEAKPLLDFESNNSDALPPNSPTNDSHSFRFDYSHENDTFTSEIDLTTSSASSTIGAGDATSHMELSAVDNTLFSSFLRNIEGLAERRLRKSAARHSKYQAFFNLAAEKLDQLSAYDQEKAQILFLNYLHKELGQAQAKKRRK